MLLEYALRSLEDAEIFNLLSEMVYIAYVDTCEVIFLNDALRQRIASASQTEGKRYCYELMHGRTQRCEHCKFKALSAGMLTAARAYNSMAKCDVYIKSRVIDLNGRLARLVIGFDVSRVEREKGRLSNALMVQEMISESLHILNEMPDPSKAYALILQNFGETLRASRAYLCILRRGLFYTTAEWCAEGVASQKEEEQGMSPQLFARWMDRFRGNHCVCVEDVEEVRGVDRIEYRIMENRGARSYIVAPIRMHGHVIGLLGIENAPQDLAQDIEPLLASVAYYIAVRIRMNEHTALLETMSFHDAMTGCGNRNAYMRRKDQLERSASRHTVGVIFFDLNKLKETNDTLGHEYGNKLIQKVARILCSAMPQELVYRTGGDEFVALLVDKREQEVSALVDAIKAAVRNDATLSVSVGMAWEDAPHDIQALVDRADEAMYEEKVRYHRKQEGSR